MCWVMIDVMSNCVSLSDLRRRVANFLDSQLLTSTIDVNVQRNLKLSTHRDLILSDILMMILVINMLTFGKPE